MEDWDLHAVGAAPVSTNNAVSLQPLFTHQQDFSVSCFEDLSPNGVIQEELHDLYKPFFPKSEIPFSILSCVLVTKDPPPQIAKQLAPQIRPKQQQSFSVSNGSKTSSFHTPTTRSNRRKSYTKKVCHVAAENLSSDVWSWRKYGQKSIKGSPYPRGYYRCSTSKGCLARKQVERNRSDPGMFIVAYTAEQNHPMPTHQNSLAESTRHKPAEVPTSAGATKDSLLPEKLETSREDDLADDDDDAVFSVSEMALDDDFFVGLEDFIAASPDACHLQYPWLSTTATTTGGS